MAVANSFSSPAEFLAAVRTAGVTGSVPANLRPYAVAGSDEHHTGSDPYGGFFSPFGVAQFPVAAVSRDPSAERVTPVQMGMPKLRIPARTDKNHTTTITGGLVLYRLSETDEIPSSRIAYDQVTLDAQSELIGVLHASESLVDDCAGSFGAVLDIAFRDELAGKMLDEKINGTGVGQFLGILNTPALITVAKTALQPAKTVTDANVRQMRARCWGFDDAIWFANHDAFEQLAALAEFERARSESEHNSLCGRPVFDTEFCQPLGTVGDLVLVNWSQYLLGTYEPVRGVGPVAVRFLAHEQSFKFWTRVAGVPWWRAPLTPKYSPVTLSPYVALETRA